LEKIYAGYKKLGEWNLAKLFKIEEKNGCLAARD
jgi:hypothetical protein